MFDPKLWKRNRTRRDDYPGDTFIEGLSDDAPHSDAWIGDRPGLDRGLTRGHRLTWAGVGLVGMAIGIVVTRALLGHDDLSKLRAWLSGDIAAREAALDEMLDESFPASDPPSQTATSGARA
jgi:hypothetical protein